MTCLLAYYNIANQLDEDDYNLAHIRITSSQPNIKKKIFHNVLVEKEMEDFYK